jgi:predicted DNA-binding transcriptional regulator YafY
VNQTERLYKIEQMLAESAVVPIATFLDRLEVSRATFKRDLDYLRDRLHAPIVFDRFAGGYRFESSAPRQGPRHALPGLWFNASEAYALLAMQQLVKEIEPGLLAAQVEPLKARLRALLGSTEHAIDEVEKRIRVVSAGTRRADAGFFAHAAQAVLSRRRMDIVYFSRGSGEETRRVISPQRLVSYRGNWYLDAWCHLREDLRSFAVDALRQAEVLAERARGVPERDLQEHYETSYGIFSGRASRTARLRFSAERARWVAHETWHPRQQGSFEADGGYVLEFPYHDDRELVMDILRHGAEVEVISPDSLRDRVVAEARRIVTRAARR